MVAGSILNTNFIEMWWTWELGAEKGQIKRGIAEGKGDYESGSDPGKTDFF